MSKSKPTPEVFEINIDKIVYGGDGLGRHDGQTVFVPFGAPGDHLRVRVIESKRNFKRAVIDEIITSSPMRRPAPCEHFGICGGCQIQHLNYEAQLETKVGFIRESLRRMGHIDWTEAIPIIHGEEWAYRARAQFKIDHRNQKVGFYRASSHAVEDIASCPLLRSELNEELAQLRENRNSFQTINEAVIAAGNQEISRRYGNSDEAAIVTQTVGELNYRFDANTFFQVNPGLLEKMVDVAIGNARGELAVDLYCGVGLFTVPLSKQFQEVIGVEGNERSARFAAENVSLNGSENVSIYASSIEDWLIKNSGGDHEVDFLLLDPPRVGIEPGALSDIIAMKPLSVAYVSCDPTTLSRDLRSFMSGGYSIQSITAIDLFPQTFHVETCVRLKK